MENIDSNWQSFLNNPSKIGIESFKLICEQAKERYENVHNEIIEITKKGFQLVIAYAAFGAFLLSNISPSYIPDQKNYVRFVCFLSHLSRRNFFIIRPKCIYF